MTYVKSRKHAQPRRHSGLSAVAAGVLLLPAAVHVQAQTTQLPSVNVTATQESGFKADKSSSVKYAEPLVDTPQTLTIIKKQLIDQQGATTLTEALRNSPGVGAFYLGENGATSTGDAIYMRGFDASSSIYVDNVRDLGSISRDTFNIEQVEVLKGPAGADNGRGSPTGSINMVTKQPELNDAFSASATYGGWGQKRATADWNKALDKERGIALRLNLMTQDSGVPGRHVVNNKRSGIAPSLAFGLNSPTRIFLNYLHIDQDNVPDGGVSTVGLPGYSSPDPARPYISGAPRVNSSNFYGSVNDFNKVSADMFTVRVEHDFSPDVKLQNTTRYAKTSQDYLLTSYMARATGLITPSPTNLSTWTVTRNLPTRKDQTNEIVTNQTNVTAALATGAIKHTLVGGVELTQEKQHAAAFATVGMLPNANLYNPNPNFATPGFSINRTGYNDGKTDTVSAYLFDTLKFNEQWSINAGIREDHYRTTYFGNAPGNSIDLSTSGNLFNWKLAGIYKPTSYSSIYALYATSQQPPGGANFALSTSARSASKTDYAPQKAKSAELGTKWELLDKKLFVTAALFRTQVENEVELDQTSGLYFQTGKKTVQGIELGVIGEVTSKFSLAAGYTYMNTKVDSGAIVTASGENVLAYTPKQAITSWANYRLPEGFTIGGGVRYVSELTRGSDGAIGTPKFADAYWVVDSMLGYTVNKNVDLQFNIYNLFNKDYVGSINKSGYRYTPGSPRAFALTANFKF